MSSSTETLPASFASSESARAVSQTASYFAAFIAPGLTIGTIGLGLAMASIFPTTLTFAERRMAITSQVTGWFIVGASAGSMFLPWLIGQLFEQSGPRSTIFVVIIALLAAIGVLAALMRSSIKNVMIEGDEADSS